MLRNAKTILRKCCGLVCVCVFMFVFVFGRLMVVLFSACTIPAMGTQHLVNRVSNRGGENRRLLRGIE